MAKLALGVRKLGQKNIYPTPERLEVRKLVSDAILSIPNHAEYFSLRLGEARNAWEESGDDSKYDYTRFSIFETLRHLPSPEIIDLLGSNLHDSEWPYDPAKYGDSMPVVPNACLSVYALVDLLEDPPSTNGRGSGLHVIFADLSTWQLWFEQVKAGTRTFRFKNDPENYTLKGAVSDARVPSPGSPRSVRTDEPATVSPAISAEESPSRIPLIAAFVVLAVAAGWWLWSRQSQN
ncbi:MAG: hypothetical protein AAGB14_10425 [Verrucomicrobiota bacterium]